MSERAQNPAAAQAKSPGRRAAAYWFSDGLPEAVFGLAYLTWGVLGMAWSLRLAGRWSRTAGVAASLAFFLLWAFDRKALDWLKARLTYPRTGYVRPPAEPKPPLPGENLSIMNAPPYDENVTWFRLATVFVFWQVQMLVDMFRQPWGVPVLMTAAAVVVYVLSRSEARPYSGWTVLPIAVAGVASAWLRMPADSRLYLPILIGGAWLLARGTWTMVHYLRAHPRPAAVEATSHE